MRPGTRLRSSVCDTEVIVVTAAPAVGTIECGGVAMRRAEEAGGTAKGVPRTGYDTGTTLGKRYAAEPDGLVVLCTKGGVGALSLDGTPLRLLTPRRLPASD